MGAPLTPSTAFAGVDLLSAYLLVDIASDNLIALAALDAATAAIQSYCDQRIELVEGDISVIDGTGTDILLLPEAPVTDVSKVVVDFDRDSARTLVPPGNGSNSEYDWNEAGMLIHRFGSTLTYTGTSYATYGLWPERRRSVQVTWSHGYLAIPSDIQLICVAIAARTYAQDGATNESVGGYSATYAGQPGVITDGEKRVLDRYRTRRH
jgi:hypothetical protein